LEKGWSKTVVDLKADTEQILKDNEGSVVYSDEWVGSDGVFRHVPEMGSWYLTWKHGTITLSFDSEEKLKFEAAVFIYLFLKGTDVCIARQMAYLFVKDHYDSARNLQ
jgi:hypothetical protein